jgi:hypothetical protein
VGRDDLGLYAYRRRQAASLTGGYRFQASGLVITRF